MVKIVSEALTVLASIYNDTVYVSIVRLSESACTISNLDQEISINRLIGFERVTVSEGDTNAVNANA